MNETFATPAGTKRYFDRLRGKAPSTIMRPFGTTGLFVSGVGFGSYRVHPKVPAHAEALEIALKSGINLIDTSTNYMDGGSESVIGKVLTRLFSNGTVARDEVIVVSKAGYLQGNNRLRAEMKEREGQGFSEVEKLSPDLWHCFSPDFLQDQISESLARLKLSTLDVLLIHNPEYFLKKNSNFKEYHERLKKAFEHLETEVQKGRIRYYGVSSNTFPESTDSSDFTSLSALCDPEFPNFKVIQFPFNLFELGAVFEENNEGHTVLEFAQNKGLACLANRPLNAFYGNEVQRLADFSLAEKPENLEHDIQRWLTDTLTLESLLVNYPEANKKALSWGHAIQKNRKNIHDFLSFRDLLRFDIYPGRDAALDEMNQSGNANAAEWAKNYKRVTDGLFMALLDQLEHESAILSERMKSILDRRASDLKSNPTLSQKSVRVLMSVPGVDCVLVGMRRPEYVEDILGIQSPLKTADAFETLTSAEEWVSEL